MIAQNISNVKKIMNLAAEKAGRNTEDITLISVSKTKPVSMLLEAYEAGSRDFGENKVQELIDKYEVMPQDIRWHMIGHLQRNKVKYIVGKVALIHSVDSLKLAEEISKEALKKEVTVSVLIEVNVAGEESKYGVSPQEAEELIRQIAILPGIKIEGLMTIAPYVDNSEDNRQYFAKLRQLLVDINSKNIDNVNMNVLSMGMTGDYAVAIEEGATYVRVGTGIFGDRQYTV
ncbi:MAG: YggS family pyridoxal phosphate-dependent enzyme [Lachnospiraceae bacterium]|nr:YggS family pyridoxal phosphate-dependent enzyme [Lachnospiraceae bacterium]